MKRPFENDMVVCVVFATEDYAHHHVVTMIKQRPAQQRGMANLPGGHILKEEADVLYGIEHAASRELLEETNIAIDPLDWEHVGEATPGAHFYVLVAQKPRSVIESQMKQMTDEPVFLADFNDLVGSSYLLYPHIVPGPILKHQMDHIRIIPNLRYILPKALQVVDKWRDPEVE